MEFLRDLWDFLKERKAWWLVPIILVLLVVSVLVILGGTAGFGPFAYVFG